jgi:hypothetical protein
MISDSVGFLSRYDTEWPDSDQKLVYKDICVRLTPWTILLSYPQNGKYERDTGIPDILKPAQIYTSWSHAHYECCPSLGYGPMSIKTSNQQLEPTATAAVSDAVSSSEEVCETLFKIYIVLKWLVAHRCKNRPLTICLPVNLSLMQTRYLTVASEVFIFISLAGNRRKL